MPHDDGMRSLIDRHRAESKSFVDRAKETYWDDQARRDWGRLARWHAREADRLERASNGDFPAERRRFNASAGRRGDLDARIFDRYVRRRSRHSWRPQEAQVTAAVAQATAVADWWGLSIIGPVAADFVNHDRPRRWEIRYFAQSRYRGGEIRAVVGSKFGRLLRVEVELVTGAAGGPLEWALPPWR